MESIPLPNRKFLHIPNEIYEGKTLEDKRWESFSNEEIKVLDNLISICGEPDPEIGDRIVRGLLTEMKKRNLQL